MAEQSQDPKQPVQIKIRLDDEIAQGQYSNLVMLSHSESEFILDFMFLQPGRQEARVGSRSVLAPIHAKRLVASLADHIKRYEERFGPISTNASKNNVVH